MMDRKDFEQIAHHLFRSKPASGASLMRAQWNADIGAVADACERVHPGFDRGVFLAACGGED